MIPLWQQSKIFNRQKVILIWQQTLKLTTDKKWYHIFYTNRRFLVCGYRHLAEKIWGCRGWQYYYLPRMVNFWGCRRKRRNCQSHVTADRTNPRYIYIERFNNLYYQVMSPLQSPILICFDFSSLRIWNDIAVRNLFLQREKIQQLHAMSSLRNIIYSILLFCQEYILCELLVHVHVYYIEE